MAYGISYPMACSEQGHKWLLHVPSCSVVTVETSEIIRLGQISLHSLQLSFQIRACSFLQSGAGKQLWALKVEASWKWLTRNLYISSTV